MAVMDVIRCSTGDVQNGGRQVDHAVARNGVGVALRDAGTADEEGNVNVLFKRKRLARLATAGSLSARRLGAGIHVLASEGVSVVGRVKDVGVFELASLLQTMYNFFDELVNRLQYAKAATVEFVEVSLVSCILFPTSVSQSDLQSHQQAPEGA
jgi:hypothetical protein